MTTRYYYHAGAMNDQHDVRWSDSTRRSAGAAEREAIRLSRQHGAQPVVEYWDRKHGLQPGDCDAVAGAYVVKASA